MSEAKLRELNRLHQIIKNAILALLRIPVLSNSKIYATVGQPLPMPAAQKSLDFQRKLLYNTTHKSLAGINACKAFLYFRAINVTLPLSDGEVTFIFLARCDI